MTAYSRLENGSIFAGYRIEEEIGRGGMALVYRATDPKLERPLALKLITPELASDQRFRERFLRESRLAASLDHPNVVPVFEAGEHEGQLFIAMRYVEGTDLRALLTKQGRLAPERALSIVGPVADALDAAHAKGLVHRDVKPANVLLDGREHAYLTDFGLTRKQAATQLTATGQLMGTLDYLAPEQIRGEELDGRSDQYALASLLYECLTGEPPFHRESEAETLWAHMQGETPALPDHPALDAVVGKGLAKAKEDRYESCGELVASARQALWLEAAEGVATIMFTDVEGSTALTTRVGDVTAKRLIEAQRQIVRKQVAGHGGRVIDSIGDGFMVAFDSTRRALACALSIQEALLERAKSEPERAMRLRIGLNVGEVLERHGHPFGAAVNAAARIGAVAKGGEVVVSDAVRQLAGTTPGISFRDRGRFRLKGFQERWRLYEVVSREAAPAERPPLRAALRPFLPPALLRHRRKLLLAGVLLLAGAAAAAVVQLTGGGSSAAASPLPNSVVEIDPNSNELRAQITLGSNPTTLAVGEGAVWLLNADDQTISRIDPQSKQQKTFGIGTTPIDLAVGAGAVWIGNGTLSRTAQFGLPVLSSVSRVDPETFGVQGTTRLRSKGPGGDPGDAVAVGKDAVWAVNPDLSVSRIDPGTGGVVATVRSASVVRIAVGPTGSVWGLSFKPNLAVVRIDPRTNTVATRIKIPSQDLTDIAVGAGAVWVSSPQDGTVWRIDSGPPIRERTVPVEKGVDQLAFGEGSVWAVNSLRGTLSRIDPATNLVSRTMQIQGTPRDVAVGDGRVWVSDAGASCGKIVYGGKGDPQYLVVSDLPLRAGPGFPALAMSRAIEHVFRNRGYRAGRHKVAYQSCDDSTSQVGIFDVPKCAANAKSYAAGASVLGVIGSFNSGCSFNQIPLLNQAPGGPLAMVSPSNSYVGLTRRDPFAPPGQLASLYPTGVRNFARVYPPDDAHGAAAAIFINSLGIEKAYVLEESEIGPYPKPLVRSFRKAAEKRGLEVVGSASWDPQAKSYAALVERVKRSGARAVFLAGLLGDQGGGLKELRSRLGPRVTLVASAGSASISDLFRVLGPAARTIYVTYLGLTNERLPAGGRRFVDAFSATQRGSVHPIVAYAAQAAEVLLDAIARSDGTRASVTKELFATQVRNGILGTFRFDRNGDTTLRRVTILRPRRPGGSRATQSPEGASVVRVIDVPPSLLP